MPTIPQLPLADSFSPQDELPLAQGTTTRSIQLATILASVQPTIALSSGSLLGRSSPGTGTVEPILPGSGLTLAGGVLANSSPGFRFGTGSPVAGVGADGDAWLDVSTGEMWSRQASVWHDTGANVLAPEAAARMAALQFQLTLQGTSVGAAAVTLAPVGASAGMTNVLALGTGRCVVRLTGAVVAMDRLSGDAIIWDLAAAVRRHDVGGAAAMLGSPAVSVFSSDAGMGGCVLAVSTDGSSCLVQGSGLSGRVIDWTATLWVVRIP